MDPFVIFFCYIGLLFGGVLIAGVSHDFGSTWGFRTGLALMGLVIFKMVLIVLLN